MKKIIFVITIFLSANTFAADSTLIDTSYIHIRKRAAILSLIIPGTGQFYNEIGHRKVQGKKNISWWRAPLFWVGLTTTAYFAYFNGKEATQLKKEWQYRSQNNGQVLFPQYNLISTQSLIDGDNNYTFGFLKHAKWRDYNIAGFAFIYALNILDAYTDAHFVTFNVSKNLALYLTPKMYSLNQCGLSLNFIPKTKKNNGSQYLTKTPNHK